VDREIKDLAQNAEDLRSDLLVLKYEIAARKLLRTFKAGFNPQEPRDELGRWTDEGGRVVSNPESVHDVGQVFPIFADLESIPFAQRMAPIANSEPNDGSLIPKPAGVTVTYNNAVTGDERIDQTTKRLTNTLKAVMNVVDVIPYSAPRLYGTAVHTAFAIAVRAQNMDNVDVEISYKNKQEATYGEEESVRADVALSSVAGEVIAIYDVKTGGAKVSTSRADELRRHFTASRYVPVIELHVIRGSRIKHAAIGSYSWSCARANSRLASQQ
jgi:hypothetical protein